MGRQNQPVFKGFFCFQLIDLVQLALTVNVGDLKIVFTVFHLTLVIDIAIGDVFVPLHLAEVMSALQRHGDALQPIGDLYSHGVNHQSTCLLEVGKLGDLLPVQPDFPAKTPGA
ncbi:hypothetical protein SDC9_105214 [bioreactor metagenome]|uniref:Uncharacterized protein n=1 Tax=bioreactor metagenome TaxID=1076179 RepID=A0A645B5G3_9ZZZZ